MRTGTITETQSDEYPEGLVVCDRAGVEDTRFIGPVRFAKWVEVGVVVEQDAETSLLDELSSLSKTELRTRIHELTGETPGSRATKADLIEVLVAALR